MNNPLSPTEYRIMLLLTSGQHVKEIAKALETSPETVRNCSRDARLKLYARTTIQAAVIFDRMERKRLTDKT